MANEHVMVLHLKFRFHILMLRQSEPYDKEKTGP